MESIVNVLYLLTLTGPLFQISNVIGTDRTRFIETWLLNTFYSLFKISILFMKLALFFMIVSLLSLLPLLNKLVIILYEDHLITIIFTFIVNIVIAIYLQNYLGYIRLVKYTKLLAIDYMMLLLSLRLYLNDCSEDYAQRLMYCQEGYHEYVIWLIIILFYITLIWLQYILTYTYFYAQTKISHKYLVEYSKSWRKELDKTPPWPISSIERGFEAHKVYWILSGSFPLFIIYGIIIPSIMLLLIVVLLPFWGAEKLRQYLTPEKPIYLDLLGYLISVISVILIIMKGNS